MIIFKMRSHFSNILLFLLFLAITAIGREEKIDLKVYPYWHYIGHPSNGLYDTTREVAFRQLDARKEKLQQLKTADDWKTYQKAVHEKLIDAMGPLPEKNPLNPVITDSFVRDGIRIDKLYYESRPKFYTSAIFCRPAEAVGKLPAIIHCSGHSVAGFRAPHYQKDVFNLAKKGFAVLAFDPFGQGERIFYLKADGSPKYSSTVQHSYPGSQAFLMGLPPANIFLWDGMRAVDYLYTRDEVDQARIGITGVSGGGTQTSYIASLDSRIAAAAPGLYLTTFRKLMLSAGLQDAEQNPMGMIQKGLDLPDFVIARAPKPTLIFATLNDPIFSIQGARNVYRQAQRAFQAYGSPEQINMAEAEALHKLTQKNSEASYAFFQKTLNNPGNYKQEEIPEFTEEELWVTKSGNIYKDLGGEDLYTIAKKYLDDKEAAPKLSEEKLREKIKKESGYHEPDPQMEVVFSGMTSYDEQFQVEKYLLYTHSKYPLPVIRVNPIQQPAKKLILYLADEGKEALFSENDTVLKWVNQGYSVVLADLSGMGELGEGYGKADALIDGIPLNIWYSGIMTGRNLLGITAEEINRLRDFITEKNTNNLPVSLIARDVSCQDLAHAVFLKPGTEKVIYIRPLKSYHSLVARHDYSPKYLMSALPGALQYYDLPQLINMTNDYFTIAPVDGLGNFTQAMQEISAAKLYEIVTGALR